MQEDLDNFDEQEGDSGDMPASIFSLTPPEFEEVDPAVAEQEYKERAAKETGLDASLIPRGEIDENDEYENKNQDEWKDPFDKLDEDCALKKYIFAISRDYTDAIDVLGLDARSAFVNDAISLKLEKDKEDEKKEAAIDIIRHITLVILTVIIGVPVMFILVNKSIDLTMGSYKYVQVNFEKLYKEKVQKDAIMQSE